MSESDCSELLSLNVWEYDKAVLWLVLVAFKSIGLVQWIYKKKQKKTTYDWIVLDVHSQTKETPAHYIIHGQTLLLA